MASRLAAARWATRVLRTQPAALPLAAPRLPLRQTTGAGYATARPSKRVRRARPVARAVPPEFLLIDGRPASAVQAAIGSSVGVPEELRIDAELPEIDGEFPRLLHADIGLESGSDDEEELDMDTRLPSVLLDSILDRFSKLLPREQNLPSKDPVVQELLDLCSGNIEDAEKAVDSINAMQDVADSPRLQLSLLVLKAVAEQFALSPAPKRGGRKEEMHGRGVAEVLALYSRLTAPGDMVAAWLTRTILLAAPSSVKLVLDALEQKQASPVLLEYTLCLLSANGHYEQTEELVRRCLNAGIRPDPAILTDYLAHTAKTSRDVKEILRVYHELRASGPNTCRAIALVQSACLPLLRNQTDKQLFSKWVAKEVSAVTDTRGIQALYETTIKQALRVAEPSVVASLYRALPEGMFQQLEPGAVQAILTSSLQGPEAAMDPVEVFGGLTMPQRFLLPVSQYALLLQYCQQEKLVLEAVRILTFAIGAARRPTRTGPQLEPSEALASCFLSVFELVLDSSEPLRLTALSPEEAAVPLSLLIHGLRWANELPLTDRLPLLEPLAALSASMDHAARAIKLVNIMRAAPKTKTLNIIVASALRNKNHEETMAALQLMRKYRASLQKGEIEEQVDAFGAGLTDSQKEAFDKIRPKL